ncbi:helix-turn-helix domain-containing protein [Janibacter melonis]|uniref:Helix-turn-helix domain-containing protein n=1 Tax=Janibacter melonis TaxID=262209 RepID=A0A650GF11_9MICO|nr:helix-turn-helix transcriptional regulator [Janibacter melonis]QGX08545.1 helix-turn-helix domain-containing protein [Janibacter melonis]
MARNPLGDLGNGLGDYLREQRLSARLSVRQLSELAGVSNPYLSQIERGLKRPSADILQQIAKGLSISAETLYVQAGLLDPDEEAPAERPTAREAIAADLRLTSRQRQTLIDIYDSFVGSPADAPAPPRPEKTAARSREATPSSTTPKKRTTTPRKRTSATRTSSATSRSTKTTS